jgi:DNA repair exonuclease SbcCD nuclease subunit
MSFLIIGDVHVVPQELGDCQALAELIYSSIEKYQPSRVVFLGDQHNAHNILESRCVDYWTTVIDKITKLLKLNEIYPSLWFIIGNHDCVTPTIMMPHSMVAHKFRKEVIIVDKPINTPEFCLMPYYSDPVKFVEDAQALKTQDPDCNILFCHQTFTGADEGKGFYSDVAVESSSIPFKTIISGHIHKPMRLGRVWYPGSPRWRTLTDADVQQRNIYFISDTFKVTVIPTNTHCKRIYKFEDSEQDPAVINLTKEEVKLADIRVTIRGSGEYIKNRMMELKTVYHAKCRSIPDKSKSIKVSESEGIEKAFQKYYELFTPPNGTDKNLLLKEINARV